MPANLTPKQRLAALVGAGCCTTLLAIVPGFEGTVLHAYFDPVGVATYCTGATDGVVMGKSYTVDECSDVLAKDLYAHAERIAECIAVPVNENQRAAFVSLAFNIGTGAFCSSTLKRRLNAYDYAGACAEISRWRMAGGREWPGLVKRRAAERQLCETPVAAQ